MAGSASYTNTNNLTNTAWDFIVGDASKINIANNELTLSSNLDARLYFTSSSYYVLTFKMKLSSSGKFFIACDYDNSRGDFNTKYGVRYNSNINPHLEDKTDSNNTIANTTAPSNFPRNTYFDFSIMKIQGSSYVMSWKEAGNNAKPYHMIYIPIEDYYNHYGGFIGFELGNNMTCNIKDLQYYSSRSSDGGGGGSIE